jgi:hypothetical protein
MRSEFPQYDSSRTSSRSRADSRRDSLSATPSTRAARAPRPPIDARAPPPPSPPRRRRPAP